MKLVLSPLAVLAIAGLAQANPSRVVEMEIVDTPKQGPVHTAKLAIAVVEDHGWFASDTRDGSKLSVRIDREHDPSAGSVLQVDVQRRDLEMHAARAVPMQKSLMGRVEHESGATEVFAIVR